jgi:hypothetical protein
MLRLNLWFRANYNRKILGKVTYLIFKAKFHGYGALYWLKVNLIFYLNIILH